MEEWSDACEVEKSENRDAVIVTGERKDWGQCRNLALPRGVRRGVCSSLEHVQAQAPEHDCPGSVHFHD